MLWAIDVNILKFCEFLVKSLENNDSLPKKKKSSSEQYITGSSSHEVRSSVIWLSEG